MRNLAGQFRALMVAAAIGLAATPVAHAADTAIPATPEAGPFKIGIEPWLGYGQWHVADAKGLFKTNGLSDVQIVNFAEDKDINAALASGQLDAANIATHTAMGMVAAGLPVKIVLLLDVSMTADAIIAGKDVTSIADLKGKQVAFEEGTTSDILLKYALAKNGMSIADVQPVPMPASDAGGALIAGRVPVAVTYEPYLTVAMAQNKDVKLLFSAGEDPGLISDVLVVRDEVIKSRPGQVLAMIKSWDAALKDYNADTPGGRAIIAKAVGSDVKDLNTAFDGVRYYSLAENKTALTGDFTTKTFADVEAAAKNAKLLQADVTPEQMIDPSFVKAAQ
ncbi:transporter substrate-binding domain-containing protein [Mesorhizobium intechi]|uniref:ABC transporter substrate-binding protein n=1 Tax=Mesorhizobium intechi TaxID=537601 RepID=UPI000CC7846E|nr:ABC transporter substrate-binding protein [Mesorhizobium intechi]TSE03481.1 transporter substrate-binding domain-containing protein [Mesorhizobium intechi]